MEQLSMDHALVIRHAELIAHNAALLVAMSELDSLWRHASTPGRKRAYAAALALLTRRMKGIQT